jgi:hypothetical protein
MHYFIFFKKISDETSIVRFSTIKARINSCMKAQSDLMNKFQKDKKPTYR